MYPELERSDICLTIDKKVLVLLRVWEKRVNFVYHVIRVSKSRPRQERVWVGFSTSLPAHGQPTAGFGLHEPAHVFLAGTRGLPKIPKNEDIT